MDLLRVSQTSVSYVSEQLQYKKKIQEGIYAALGRLLSPKVIGLETMRTAVTNRANQAILHGYSTLTKVVLNLFELPISIYRTKDGTTLDIFVYVPLYEVAFKATI